VEAIGVRAEADTEAAMRVKLKGITATPEAEPFSHESNDAAALNNQGGSVSWIKGSGQ
jgi:hypothetical protein